MYLHQDAGTFLDRFTPTYGAYFAGNTPNLVFLITPKIFTRPKTSAKVIFCDRHFRFQSKAGRARLNAGSERVLWRLLVTAFSRPESNFDTMTRD